MLKGGEGWGEVGDSSAFADAPLPAPHLTLPIATRRVPSLSPRRAERESCAHSPQERDRLRLSRHSRASGNPGLPLHRSPWTPAFAGVTEGGYLTRSRR